MRPNNSYSVCRKNKVQHPNKGRIFYKMLIWNGSKLTGVTTYNNGMSFGNFTFGFSSIRKMRYKILLMLIFSGLKGYSFTHADTLDIAPNLDSVYAHFQEEQKRAVLEGYTIQLFSGDRVNANKVRANVIDLDLGQARIVYKAPNFKVHVGAYPTVLMAEKDRQRWIEFFPDAFVIQTLVPWYPIEFPTVAVPDSLAAPQDSLELRYNKD